MKRFRLSTLAEADLEEIWLYVARDRTVEVANRLIDDIMDRIVLLASHPKAGRPRTAYGRRRVTPRVDAVPKAALTST